jgi:6-pyruvoyltetrahydropterin/6-carboxytetrahydropterin synthase
MYSLQAEATFDAAHFLQGHEGACRNLHGHRWLVRVEICGEDLQQVGTERGMLLDFAAVKRELRELAAGFDHKFIYEAGSLRPQTVSALLAEDFALVELPFRPTAEELARWFYRALRERGVAAAKVWVFETPENCAAYWE